MSINTMVCMSDQNTKETLSISDCGHMQMFFEVMVREKFIPRPDKKGNIELDQPTMEYVIQSARQEGYNKYRGADGVIRFSMRIPKEKNSTRARGKLESINAGYHELFYKQMDKKTNYPYPVMIRVLKNSHAEELTRKIIGDFDDPEILTDNQFKSLLISLRYARSNNIAWLLPTTLDGPHYMCHILDAI